MMGSFEKLVVIAAAFAVILLLLNGIGRSLFPLEYKDLVIRYAKENDLDPFLVFSVIKAESNFNPNATSHKNARGLMQIIDDTGIWAAEKMGIEGFRVEHLYDPKIILR